MAHTRKRNHDASGVNQGREKKQEVNDPREEMADSKQDDVITELTCVITSEIFFEPVALSCGCTYEREAIERYRQSSSHCPLCKGHIAEIPDVNRRLKNLAEIQFKNNPDMLKDHYFSVGVLKKILGNKNNKYEFLAEILIRKNPEEISDCWRYLASHCIDPSFINVFTKVVDRLPSSPHAYLARAMTQFKDNIDEALNDCNRALALDPQNGFAIGLRGAILYYSHRMDESLDELNRSLEINPDNSFALGYRSAILILRNDIEKGYQDSVKAIHLDPENYFAVGQRGIAFSHKGMRDDALKDLNIAITNGAPSPHFLHYRAHMYLMFNSYEMAIADFTKLINAGVNWASIYAYRAKALEGIESFSEALEDCERELTHHSDCELAIEIRDRILKNQQKCLEAARLFSQPNNPAEVKNPAPENENRWGCVIQ